MRRRKHDYASTVTGVCGHECNAWPQLRSLKGKETVICDECGKWVEILPTGVIPGQLSLDDPEF